jgi:glutaminyl-peptide cyclotransferase
MLAKIQYSPRFVAVLLATSALALLSSCHDSSLPDASSLPPEAPPALVNSPDFAPQNALRRAIDLSAMGERISGSANFLAQQEYVQQCLQEAGWTVQLQSFEALTPQGNHRFTNLRARLVPQPDWSAPPAGIITCHWDTKSGIPGFVGANDGASGVALLLELARVLKTHPSASQLELVFFDGEESFDEHMSATDGLYGSTYYAQQLTDSTKPLWGINLDMVGRRNMRMRIPPATDQPFYSLYNQAVRDLGFSSKTWGVASSPILDDHVPLEEQGVPVLNLIDDFRDGNWWHTAHDQASILSADSFRQSGLLVLRLIDLLMASGSPYSR